MKIARGSYITFIDADDYILSDSLEKVAIFLNKTKIDVCQVLMRKQHEDGTYETIFQPFTFQQVYSGEEILVGGINIGSVCNNFYSHAFLKEKRICFQTDMYHEDVDFNTNVYALAEKMVFIDVLYYSYEWNGDSRDRSIDPRIVIQRYKSDLQVAHNTKVLAKKTILSKKIRTYYRKRSNSIVVSTFLCLLHDKTLNVNKFVFFVKSVFGFKLFPIKGTTLSWKTTIFIPLVNILCLFKPTIKDK